MLTQRGLIIVLGLILFIFLWVAVWFFFFRPKAQVVEEIQVDTPQLTVFSGKGETNKVIGTVSRGEKLQILEKSDTWYKVRLTNGEIGYINSNFLKAAASPGGTGTSRPPPGQTGQPGQTGLPGQPGQPGPDEEKAIGEVYVNIKSGHLNVREGKGTNYKIIATLLKGEKVQLLDNSETWYKIRLPNGVVGYVDSRYIKTTPP